MHDYIKYSQLAHYVNTRGESQVPGARDSSPSCISYMASELSSGRLTEPIFS